jgi:hemerythrin-like domain-containing protein
MQPTEVLMSEHRVIEQVLQCLEKMAQRCSDEGRLDELPASQALDFFRTFADRCHHRKEEQHLFPMLEARGFPREHGPTGVMLHEHEQGRHHLWVLGEALKGAAAGDADAVEEFVAHARAYVQLLREHIRKEDHCLFPMAERALSESDRRALLASFTRVEDEKEHAAAHEMYLRLADDLADQFHVPRAQASGPARAGCCSHHHSVTP